MDEIRVTRIDQNRTKIRNVPIAVTPEGFWCCPSPVVFQKTNKPNSLHKKQTLITQKKPSSRTTLVVIDEQMTQSSDPQVLNVSKSPRQKIENAPKKKVTIEFGEPGTSDFKVILLGKQGVVVKLSVHKSVLVENSSFFAENICENQLLFRFLEIDECEDVEMYVETVGLMYRKDLKQQLMKQSVSRVLRILKISEQLGFTTCVQSCLEYLEAVPWVGEEEEEKVVFSLSSFENESTKVRPVLRRISSNSSKPPQDTFSHILELVLKSKDEKGRREMKSIVLKLLKENSSSFLDSSGSSDLYHETMYNSCRTSLDSLLSLFRQAAESGFVNKSIETREPILKSMVLEADNLTWMLDILCDRRIADEFSVIWSNQQELASLHNKIPIISRHHVSKITSRLLVGIGKGEILPCEGTRVLLVQTWLEPLIDDYRWLHQGSRSFDRKVVEEGIERTILTLPLEDQQSILLYWMGIFLKSGDNCPNLKGAFEVWWRRTFVRPYVEY